MRDAEAAMMGQFLFRNPPMTRSCRAAVLALTLFAAFAAPTFAEEPGGGSGKKSAFAPGEHTLVLPPLWVPVKGLRSRTPGVSGYRPVTVRLTSQHDGGTTMCYRLPYITEALLFALTRDPIGINKDGTLDFGTMETALLNETTRVTGTNAVKRLELINGVPPASKTNQDLLELCQ